jgi:hypothetical protein
MWNRKGGKMKTILISIIFLFLFSTLALGAITSVSLVNDDIWKTGKKILLVKHSGVYGDIISFSDTEPRGTKVDNGILQNTYTLKVDTLKNDALYPIIRLYYVYKAQYITSPWKLLGWSDTDRKNWIRDNCFDFDGDGLKWAVWNFFQIACLKDAGLAGWVYRVDSPKSDWLVRFTVSSDSTTATKDFSSAGDWGGYIGNLVFARFDGLTTVDYVPYPISLRAFYDSDLKSYYIIDDDSTSTYRTNIINDGYELAKKVFSGEWSVDTFNTVWNSAIRNMRIWTKSSDFSPTVATIDGNGIRRDIKRLTIPSFNMYLNGQYFEIKIPRGKPQIENVWWEVTKLIEARTYNLWVSVKNVGDQSGDFVITATCQAPASVVSSTYVRSVSPGETKSAYIQVSFPDISVDKITNYCTIKAKDTVSQEESTYTISYTVINQPYCEEDREFAEQTADGGWVVKVCKNGMYQTKYTCPPGKYPVKKDGYYEGCAEKPAPPTPGACAWWDIACHIRNFISWIVETITTALIFIGALVVIGLVIYIMIKLLKR